MSRLLRPLFATAAAALFAAGLAVAPATPVEAAACKSPSYCRGGGPCVTTAVVRKKARQAFGIDRGAPWRIARIRLVGQAPTATCLWYEVWMKGPNGAGKTAYWDIDGRRVR